MKKAMLFLGLYLFLVRCSEQQATPPNIVIIFTDDQGYGDLSCFGSSTIATPNIDALAANGLKLTDFHVTASTCTPSRASLLTGCYPDRVGLPNVLFPDGAWGTKDNIGINPKEETIAELLKPLGYATAMAGKWHLGHREKFLPLQHGFDHYLGIPYSNDMARGKLTLLKDNETIEIEPDQSLLTKRYTEFGIDFIHQNAEKKPFFLYLAHTMPHIPIFASATFKGKSKGGLYGDVIEEIDWSTGEIIQALKEQNILNNTLVIFTSDNGPWLSYGNHGGDSGGLRGGKFDVFEGGFRVPAVLAWPAVIPKGQVSDELISTLDLLPTICAITGATLPMQKIDGLNILPLLKRQKMPTLNDRFFYYFSNKKLLAVRRGDWKYIAPHKAGIITEPGKDGINGKGEGLDIAASLYNLKEDVTENKNIINQHHAIATTLKNSMDSFYLLMQQEARPIGIVEEDEKK